VRSLFNCRALAALAALGAVLLFSSSAQSATETVTAGQPVTFSVNASGTTPFSYQWFKDGTAIAGATAATYSISSVLATDAGGYSAVVSNAAGSATSDLATLSVNNLPAATAPAFTTQPVSQTVTAGSSVTFAAAASGSPTPTYQWQKNGSNIAGATGASYSLSDVTSNDVGTFAVLATNSAGSATSSGATLTVNSAAPPVAAPAIVTQPASQSVCAGVDATFVAAASGSPAPTYQWQVSTDGGSTWTNLTDTAGYSGTATATLTVCGATAAMNGYVYRCLASNSVLSNVNTSIACLDVTPSAVVGGVPGSVIPGGFTAVWNVVSGAAGYRLDVSTNSSFTSFVTGFQNLDVGNATAAAIGGLSANTTYYYRVRAYDSAGTGLNSSTVTVETSAPIVITTPLNVSTLAGQPLSSGGIDGAGGAARFYSPTGIAADTAGNLYLADTDNHTIRKIVSSTGAVTTLAGLPGSSGSTDGTGSAARFNNPSGVAVDNAGNVFVADTMNNTVRKITTSGVVTTLAGSPGAAGSIDGTGGAARFCGPQGLAIDSSNNLYVADANNQTIRRIVTSTGVVTTMAGSAGNSGNTDGAASVARFSCPSGVAVDSAGNLYVADTDNHTIRRISSGTVSTLAGLSGNSGAADGTGSTARFNSPSDLAVDSSGNVYVADTDNFTIRAISASTGTVSTLAGLAETSGSADGLGSAVRFFYPAGIAVDNHANLYVSDTNNDTVREGQLPSGPTILTQPQSQAVNSGASAQFSVAASGCPAVTYQWYFNGTAITGATGCECSLTSAQSGNVGNYTVVVSNSIGSVTSNAAALTINAAALPSISASSGGSASGGGGGAPSAWFCGGLLMLAAARILQRATRRNCTSSPESE